MYLDHQAPKILNKSLSSHTQTVCALGYVALDSGISKTPLWSAEKLTRERVLSAEHMHRDGQFHAEDSLSSDMRAELSDYSHSGYDRGHMAPSGDMPDENSQQQSFSLANIVPQNSNNNRGLWAGIEASVRNLAKDNEIYVVTGPVFNGSTVERIGHRVMVPTSLFKAVYNAKTKQAAAYITPNAPGESYKVVSIAELNSIVGIDVFPSLNESIKTKIASLPAPKKISFKDN
jgi:endonuclease G